MAGSGGRLTKWLVNKTVVEPTKRKLEETKTKVTKSTAASWARKATGKSTSGDPTKCEVCGKDAAQGRNLCGRPACAKALVRDWGQK